MPLIIWAISVSGYGDFISDAHPCLDVHCPNQKMDASNDGLCFFHVAVMNRKLEELGLLTNSGPSTSAAAVRFTPNTPTWLATTFANLDQWPDSGGPYPQEREEGDVWKRISNAQKGMEYIAYDDRAGNSNPGMLKRNDFLALLLRPDARPAG